MTSFVQYISVAPTDTAVAAILHIAGVKTGKIVTIIGADGVKVFGTGWDGGSQNTFTAIKGSKRVELRGREAFRDEPGQAPVAELAPLGSGSALPDYIVASGTFLGKPAYVAIFVHPSRIAPFLPVPVDLDDRLADVLGASCALNSKGRAAYRDREGMTRKDWDSAVVTLAERGLMTARGAVTPDGQNVAQADKERRHRSW